MSSLDHCNWNEPNGSSNWTKFYQESFLSFLLEERRMSRWYFISVECDGNDFEMILRSCFPTLPATSRLNRVRTTAIPILYSPHIPASLRSRNLVHGRTSKADAEETYMKIYRFARRAISIQFVNCFAVVDNSACRVKLHHNPRTHVEFVINGRACGIEKIRFIPQRPCDNV